MQAVESAAYFLGDQRPGTKHGQPFWHGLCTQRPVEARPCVVTGADGFRANLTSSLPEPVQGALGLAD